MRTASRHDRLCAATFWSVSGPASVLVLLLLLAAACGRDPVKDAIRRLSGPPAEVNRARMDLRLMNEDPFDELTKTARDPHARPRTRILCVEILGDIARRQRDEKVFDFLIEMLKSPDLQLREAAVKGFVDTYCDKAVPALIAAKQGADRERLKRIDKAIASTAEHLVREVEKMWNSPEAAMAEYERAEKIGLDRGAMGYSKGRFLEIRGQTAAAQKKFDELGLIRRWWVAGPFPNRQGGGFRQVYPPEQEIRLMAEYLSGYGKVNWYLLDRDAPAGRLDFENYFVEVDNVVGYALIFIESDDVRDAEIRSGSDDTLTVFLNGEEVWAHEQYRGLKFDDDVIDIKLKKGLNAALFKVCEDWGAWELVARITGPGDTPLKGVLITTELPGATFDWQRN